jgi:hypothetical protein
VKFSVKTGPVAAPSSSIKINKVVWVGEREERKKNPLPAADLGSRSIQAANPNSRFFFLSPRLRSSAGFDFDKRVYPSIVWLQDQSTCLLILRLRLLGLWLQRGPATSRSLSTCSSSQRRKCPWRRPATSSTSSRCSRRISSSSGTRRPSPPRRCRASRRPWPPATSSTPPPTPGPPTPPPPRSRFLAALPDKPGRTRPSPTGPKVLMNFFLYFRPLFTLVLFVYLCNYVCMPPSP